MQHNDYTNEDEDAINMSLALDVIDYVKKALPRGSVNKKSDEEKIDHPDLILKLAEMRRFSNSEAQLRVQERLKPALELGLIPEELTYQCLAEIFREYKVGNCLEQSIVGWDYLKQKGITADIYYMDGGDHYFLRIGNVVCDPWADSCFLFKDFEQHQKDSVNLKYADFIYDQKGSEEVKPYLFGIPKKLEPSHSLQKSISSASSNIKLDNQNESAFDKGNTLFSQQEKDKTKQGISFKEAQEYLAAAYTNQHANYYLLIQSDQGFYEVAFIANKDLNENNPLIEKTPLNTSDIESAKGRISNYLHYKGISNPVPYQNTQKYITP